MALALSRREAIALRGSAGFALSTFNPILVSAAETPSPEEMRMRIFSFALNLEYMEAEYYLRGTRPIVSGTSTTAAWDSLPRSDAPENAGRIRRAAPSDKTNRRSNFTATS
jgi:hypothetical protein